MFITIIVLAAVVLAAVLLQARRNEPVNSGAAPRDHIYVSWDTMEFDKSVAAWLILRFVDANAQFRFVPKDAEIAEGVPFDIPGAEWSRKHRKCTSQCVLETIERPDPAVEKIVTMAGRTELNFWQLDRWPDTQKCFYEVKEIMDQTPDPAECIKKTAHYFDRLYRDLKQNGSIGNKN